jgi:perosamine synthetase
MKNMILLSEPFLKGNEWLYLKECIDTNWISSAGKYVDKFEVEVTRYLGCKYAIACVNGTSAIHIALLVSGVKPGDTVFVPSLTFIATVNPVSYLGATPVFIDAHKDYFCMDPEKLESKVKEYAAKGKKPKAVIPVSLYGHPVDMDPIINICREYGIVLIEDATEGIGSKYKGKPVGTSADVSCLSFNGNKLITTGGGGMIVTDNASLAEKSRYYTTQARDDKYEYYHKNIGYNYRMTNTAAAIGCAQLEQIGIFIEKKRQIAARYNDAFRGIGGVTINPEMSWAHSSCWMYSLLIDPSKCKIDSKNLFKKLNEKGIQARPFFMPTHKMPMYEHCDHNVEMANELWEKGINIPSSVGIQDADVKYIIDAITNLLK